MSKQIAVRLPDDMVRFLDDLISRGDARSRADAIAQAVERDRRWRTAARDAAILAKHGEAADLDGLAEFGARVPMDDLD